MEIPPLAIILTSVVVLSIAGLLILRKRTASKKSSSEISEIIDFRGVAGVYRQMVEKFGAHDVLIIVIIDPNQNESMFPVGLSRMDLRNFMPGRILSLFSLPGCKKS